MQFEAQFREIKVGRSASEDKVGRVVLEFRPTDELVDMLNRLYEPDAEVQVVIARA